MADMNIAKAPPGSTVLPFYATAAVAFSTLCVLMLLGIESLTTHYFNPHLLTIVHTAALGWGTMIIFGSAHQLLPVICEQDLYSPRLASFCWYTLTAGTLLLASSFWNFRTGWRMIGGGLLIVIASIAFFLNAAFTSRRCIRYSTTRLFILSSSAWLVLTVTVGLLLAINLHHPFFSKNHLEILKLHAHAGLGGWFLQLIAGVSSKLVPMFLLGKSTKGKWLRAAFFLQNAGLILFLCDGYFSGIVAARVIVYATLVAAGIACWMIFLFDAFQHRVRRKIDTLMKHTFVSFLCLVMALLTLPLVLFAKGYHFTILYGALLFMGWITGIILGKTFKTLPFIVWNSQYKSLSGKAKIPLPKQLYRESLVKYQFVLYITGIISLAAGVLTQNIFLLRFASIVWVSLSAIYLVNVMKVLLHKNKTVP
ncbi:hypothetical protein [Pseudoflavitalea rhizosphaerae]|uniref:hypothetical protein n=1 Tax=Pseudoflavitalea rhizosphaerae TaxID=1884793 RepID=UPI000F8ED163|nr:hypothetical protein [Pseudoflavitalea rhizosphaerae]